MLFNFVSEGTELQGNLGILPECILCWHDCSHCMPPAGQRYQASKEAEGSEGRVSNIYWSDRYTERWRSFNDDNDSLVFSLFILSFLNRNKFSTRIVW